MTQRLYTARPINTYKRSADVGQAYMVQLQLMFPDTIMVDPNSDQIQDRVKELKKLHATGPDGKYSEELYNRVCAPIVMQYFTNEVVEPCFAGAGLALPMPHADRVVYALGAGVGAELEKMNRLGRPTWVVTGHRSSNGGMSFVLHKVLRVEPDLARSTEKAKVYTFDTANEVFAQLTVDETRMRMYTKRPAKPDGSDGGWDRDNLQPYFLEDE